MDPDWGKRAGRPWAQELANVIKRMRDTSARIGRDPRLGKMGIHRPSNHGTSTNHDVYIPRGSSRYTNNDICNKIIWGSVVARSIFPIPFASPFGLGWWFFEASFLFPSPIPLTFPFKWGGGGLKHLSLSLSNGAVVARRTFPFPFPVPFLIPFE